MGFPGGQFSPEVFQNSLRNMTPAQHQNLMQPKYGGPKNDGNDPNKK